MQHICSLGRSWPNLFSAQKKLKKKRIIFCLSCGPTKEQINKMKFALLGSWPNFPVTNQNLPTFSDHPHLDLFKEDTRGEPQPNSASGGPGCRQQHVQHVLHLEPLPQGQGGAAEQPVGGRTARPGARGLAPAEGPWVGTAGGCCVSVGLSNCRNVCPPPGSSFLKLK